MKYKNYWHILIIVLSFSIFGCARNFKLVGKRWHIELDNTIEPNESFELNNFILCYVNKGKPNLLLDKKFEDSIVAQMIHSFNKNGLKVTKMSGANLVDCSLCKYETPISTKKKNTKEKFNLNYRNDSIDINNNQLYIFPIIEIRELPRGMTNNQSASFFVFLTFTVYLIQSDKVVFKKAGRCGGISNPWYTQSEEEWENNDYSNIPIDNHIKPAHWDTLVGLVMKEYIERLR